MKKIKQRITIQIVAELKRIRQLSRSDLKGGDMTNKERAEAAGVSVPTYYNVVNGKASLESMFKVADYLGIELK